MVFAPNNGDDRSVLELRNDIWDLKWVMIAPSTEYHRGRVGEEMFVLCRNLNVKRSLDLGPSIDWGGVAYVGDEQRV